MLHHPDPRHQHRCRMAMGGEGSCVAKLGDIPRRPERLEKEDAAEATQSPMEPPSTGHRHDPRRTVVGRVAHRQLCDTRSQHSAQALGQTALSRQPCPPLLRRHRPQWDQQRHDVRNCCDRRCALCDPRVPRKPHAQLPALRERLPWTAAQERSANPSPSPVRCHRCPGNRQRFSLGRGVPCKALAWRWLAVFFCRRGPQVPDLSNCSNPPLRMPRLTRPPLTHRRMTPVACR
mmetsp:Transcript_18690/g.45030  ORF Transcript_18690/g.45030 Transcript_18690/m.45030 type:complete len:233 (-) Transcript_18690:866-1564(-)